MEKRLSALLIDDEEKAIDLLSRLLQDTDQFDEIYWAFSASSAIAKLKTFRPDLIFLDIKMPEKDGFAFLHDLQAEKICSQIIFVTAYDQYALQAIRNHAFGYLVKPVNRQELNDCLTDFRQRIDGQYFSERLDAFLEAYSKGNRLRFNTRTGYFFVDPDSILYCEADGNYTTIHTGNKQHLCSLQLRTVYEMLPKNGFERIGRSLIINFRYISTVDRKARVLIFEKDSRAYPLNISPSQIKELESRQHR